MRNKRLYPLVRSKDFAVAVAIAPNPPEMIADRAGLTAAPRAARTEDMFEQGQCVKERCQEEGTILCNNKQNARGKAGELRLSDST